MFLRGTDMARDILVSIQVYEFCYRHDVDRTIFTQNNPGHRQQTFPTLLKHSAPGIFRYGTLSRSLVRANAPFPKGINCAKAVLLVDRNYQ